MTRRENSDGDILRLIFPQMLDDGSYTLLVKADYRDIEVHSLLKRMHFKYSPETKSWLPYEKECLKEWAAADFLSFRNHVVEFIEKHGFILYLGNCLDLLQWMRDLQIFTARFCLNMRKTPWNERVLQTLQDFEIEGLVYVRDKYYLGKATAYMNLYQMELDERAREEQPAPHEIDLDKVF